MAFASGWREPDSTAAVRASRNGLADAGGGHNIRNLRFAFGQRAGFIKGDGTDAAQRLQRRAALNQRPWRVAAARPEATAAGVDITSAQGQPISNSVNPR